MSENPDPTADVTSTLPSADNFGEGAVMGTVAEADTSQVDDVIAGVADEHEDAPGAPSVSDADTSATDEAAADGSEEPHPVNEEPGSEE